MGLENKRRYRPGIGNSWEDKEALADRFWLLKSAETLPLNIKVDNAVALIEDAIKDHGAERIYVAFSGGRDSGVVSRLVEMIAPGIQFVFNNTTMEFPETLAYVRWWEKKFSRKIVQNLPFKKFMAVVRDHGYPFFSKRLADKAEIAQRGGKKAREFILANNYGWILDAGVPISSKCCYYLKHGPAEKYEKEQGFTAVILGMRAEDSRDRRRNWIARGCYYPKKNGADRVWPIALWSNKDVDEFHKAYGLPCAALYAKGFKRNGCRLCGFGSHLANPNKFELMAMHYPNYWKKAMNKYGIFDACRRLGIRDGQCLFTPKIEKINPVRQLRGA